MKLFVLSLSRQLVDLSARVEKLEKEVEKLKEEVRALSTLLRSLESYLRLRQCVYGKIDVRIERQSARLVVIFERVCTLTGRVCTCDDPGRCPIIREAGNGAESVL